MTFNRDPDRPDMRDRMRIRRDDGSWSFLPIVLGVALLLGIGILVFGDWDTRTDNPVTGTRTTGPTTTPPATSTPPATTPPTGPRQ
jgi:hypothetical protein